MTTAANAIKISKLDAARRQLQTAITLWFNQGDPVAIHTLAYAAYEIIHTVSKKRDPKRPGLLFDSLMVKEQYRSKVNIWLKRHANFFKHGDRDAEAIIEFRPTLTELFFFFAIFGLELCGERKSDAESAFVHWTVLHKSQFLSDQGQKEIAERVPVEDLDYLRTIPKPVFWQAYLTLTRQRGHR